MYMLNPDEPGQQADTKANQRNTDYHSQENGITRNLSPELAHPANSSSHKRRDICNKSIHSGHLTFYKTSLLNFFIYHHGASFRYDQIDLVKRRLLDFLTSTTYTFPSSFTLKRRSCIARKLSTSALKP